MLDSKVNAQLALNMLVKKTEFAFVTLITLGINQNLNAIQLFQPVLLDLIGIRKNLFVSVQELISI